MVARPGSGYKKMSDFVGYAQKNPGKLNFASSGVGTAGHTMGVGPQVFANFSLTDIPYKGGSDMVSTLLSDNAEASCLLPSVAMPAWRASSYRWPSQPASGQNSCPTVPHTKNWE